MSTDPSLRSLSASTNAIGPILRYRGLSAEGVRLSVTATTPLPGSRPIGTLGGAQFHAVDLDLPVREGWAALPETVRAAALTLPARVAVPAGDATTRVAFASCNGSEDEAAMDGLPGGRDAMWRGLASAHADESFHVLLMGGDQIYADALWDLPAIAAWRALPRRERLAAPFTDEMRAALEAHYLATYARAFGSPDVAAVLARVPSVMMWDDHDIIDGWGSRDASWQASPVARGLFGVARRAFALVQLGVDPDGASARDGFGGVGYAWAGDLGCARLAAPDLRSHRTRRGVMSADGHAWLGAQAAHDRPHALLVSTVPLVNADLSAVERIVGPLMPFADLFQDDLRDQWMSHGHRAEWARVVGTLLDAAGDRRVTVVSGEIHLGARGIASRDGREIEQFIASGIAHPPPPRALARGYEWFARRTRRREGIDIDMRVIAPDGRRYVAERNWLSLTLQPDGSREAVLNAERSGRLPL